MPNFFILTDGSADTTPLADPTPTNTRPAVATGATGTDGVAYCGGCEVMRLMFGGTRTSGDNETINYQVIGWQQVMGPDGEAWMPELLAGGVATLGADVYAATDMGAGTEYIADTITDTVDRKGNVVYTPENDTRAVIDIPLRGAEYVEVEVDRGTAATIDAWAMFASAASCGVGGNTMDVEVEGGDVDLISGGNGMTRLGTNGAAADVDGNQAGQLRYMGETLAAIDADTSALRDAPVEKTPVKVTQFVGTVSTAEPLASDGTFARAVYLQARKAAADNTGNVFVGLSDLDQGTAELFELEPGDTFQLEMPAGCKVDLNDIYVDADTADDGVVGWYVPA